MTDAFGDVETVAYQGKVYRYRPVAEPEVPDEYAYWGLPHRWRGRNRTVQFGAVAPSRPGATWGALFMRVIDLEQRRDDPLRVQYFALIEDQA